MRVLHLVDERLSDVERDVGLLTPPPLPEDEVLVPGADPRPFADAVTARLAAAGAPAGRVLHAECGDGRSSASWARRESTPTGSTPAPPPRTAPCRRGSTSVRDDVLGHLGSVADEALAGLVLSACVDRLSLTERRRMLRLAEEKLAPGGTVVVIGTAPGAWERHAGPVAADLSSGRPLHAETWAHLVAQAGFTDATVSPGTDAFAVLATKRPVR